MPQVDLSVIISTSQGRQSHLCSCLRALQAQTCSPLEVLVVDDGSEGMEKVLQAFVGVWPRLEYYWRPLDWNLARSRNLGAAQAHGELLVFLNGDVLLNPRALAYYQSTLQRWPQALCWGAVGCRKREVAPSLWFPEIQVNWLDFRFFPLAEDQLWLHPALEYAPHTLAGGHHFGLTRKLWEKLGPFDTRFICWGEEDVEYALRGLVAGLPMIFLGNAWAEHQVHAYTEAFHTQAPEYLAEKLQRIMALEAQLTLQPEQIQVFFEAEQAQFFGHMHHHYLRHNPGALARELRR